MFNLVDEKIDPPFTFGHNWRKNNLVPRAFAAKALVTRLAQELNYVGVRKYCFGVYPAYELHGMHPGTLASRYICFKYLDRLKRAIFQASDIAKRLGINVLLIL